MQLQGDLFELLVVIVMEQNDITLPFGKLLQRLRQLIQRLLRQDPLRKASSSTMSSSPSSS